MLLVFDKNEVLQAVLSNDGAACPFFNPIHDEKINMENIFTFEIPASHVDSQFVIEGALIAFQDLDLNWQLFEIKRIVDIDDAAGTMKHVFCDHAFYELLGDIVPSGGGAGTSANIAVVSALSQSRWEVGNVVNLGIQTTVFSYQSALSCLQQIAATWHGEMQFRIVLSGNQIVYRYVDMVAQRGTSTGKQFVFGKDLQKVEREVDFNNVYTAMYGRGKATTEGERLNFASINAGLEYVSDAVALTQYGIKGRHRFGIFDDSQEADPAILLTKTTAALQLAKVPIVNYQFQVISLEQLSSDYAHEAVRIGDTCVSIDDNFVPALQLSVRVIQIKRNLIEYDKTQITLGNFSPDLASSQTFQNRVNTRVANNSGIWDNGAALVPSVLDSAMYDLTSKLRAAGGYVVFDPVDGIMIYDTPDPATATKAMKLGAGIFGIADSKTLGAWNWRTFGTGSGFAADLMTTGKLLADRVQIGLGTTFAAGYDPTLIQVGGRNLYALSGMGQYIGGAINPYNSIYTISGYRFTVTQAVVDLVGNTVRNLDGNTLVTVSAKTNLTVSTALYYKCFDKVGVMTQAQLSTSMIPVNGKVVYKLVIPLGTSYMTTGLGQYPFVAGYYLENVKAEIGNKATDWTPAPEDVPTKTELSTGMVDFLISATNKISVNSNFYWDSSGFYAIDPLNANNVVRITSGGIGISTNGLAGPFSTAMTGEGIIAEEILAGVITGVTLVGAFINCINALTIGNNALGYPEIDFKNTWIGQVGYSNIKVLPSGIAGVEQDTIRIQPLSSSGRVGVVEISSLYTYPDYRADLLVKGQVTAESGFWGVGKKEAYTWVGAIPVNGVVTIVHNLGYVPIVQINNWNGNNTIIFSITHDTINQLRIFAYSSINQQFNGDVRLY